MSYYGNFIRAHLADRLPRLTNYREAQLWYDAVKPFSKGASAGKKPVGRNRRYDRFIIRAEATQDNYVRKDYIIKHYVTDILRYNADGSLQFNSGGMDSISTTQALQELLGADKFVRRKGKVYYKDGNGHFFRINDKLTVLSDGRVDTSTLKTEIVNELDRVAFKKLRKEYAEFMEYALLMNNLTQGGEALSTFLQLEGVDANASSQSHGFYRKNAQVALSIDTTQIRWYRNPQFNVREVFFAELEAAINLEKQEDRYNKYHHLATFMSFSASNNFSGTSWGDSDTERMYKWHVDNRRLRQFFDGLLKFRFPALVFKEVEVPLGTIRHNTNIKYFEYGTL